jgi:hypothetical protein
MAAELNFSDLAGLLTELLGNPSADTHWFRGHGCQHRKLLPSLYRRLSGDTLPSILLTETRLITRFRQTSLPLWPEGYPQSDWEHLFAMQHYGVPTRLLDWSQNALTALYFAADHDPERCECGTRDCVPTLWMLKPAEFNRNNPRLHGMPVSILTSTDPALESWRPGSSEPQLAPAPVAIYGTYNSRRIAAQQGAFTVAGKDVTPLDESPGSTVDGVLAKYQISCSHEELREKLRLLGVSEATIYPEMTGLAREITATEVGR